jgi:hypothetical protein
VHLAAWLAAFWISGSGVTFSHDVAPILYRQCAACHRPGGVAPFSLLTYQDAAKRAPLIATVTGKRIMPPWLPAAPHFRDERRLSDAEIATLARWAADGAPSGDLATAPAAPRFPDGWQLGAPDLEAKMALDFAVPADGNDIYRCFVAPASIAQDHWVRAVDMRPGNPAVVHHAILFQDISGTARRRDTGSGYDCFGTPGFLPARGLAGWTPGSQPYQAGDMPELLHAHADLVLQVHYHPNGRPVADRTAIALYFTNQKPKRQAQDIPLSSNRIDILPGDRAYKVTDHFTVPVDVDAIAIDPHAHYLCKDMLGYAVLPDGTRRTLLHIAQWNFNWQQQYLYATPIRLPAGSDVVMEFTYDNSADNPSNPAHPPRRVVWGPASTDEMAGLHIAVVPVRAGDAEDLSNALWGKMVRTTGLGGLRGR